jgi:hypothetical protein
MNLDAHVAEESAKHDSGTPEPGSQMESPGSEASVAAPRPPPQYNRSMSTPAGLDSRYDA